ncbi:hypothetical protein GGF43_006484, partial [Coemansia sp. RSA 2618]
MGVSAISLRDRAATTLGMPYWYAGILSSDCSFGCMTTGGRHGMWLFTGWEKYLLVHGCSTMSLMVIRKAGSTAII